MAISNSKCEKPLGIHIDNHLAFEPHVTSFCKKTSQKLMLFRELKFELRKFLLNAFMTSQFFMLQLFGCFTIKNKITK